MTEYRVVWRWRTDDRLFPFTREQERVYKTAKGAARRIATLNKNGGRYERWDDDPAYSRVLNLDYARLETRTVGEWTADRADDAAAAEATAGKWGGL